MIMKPTKAKIYSIMSLLLLGAQSALPSLQLPETASTIATSLILTLISIFSKLSQKENLEVGDSYKWVLNVLIIAAALGFLNDVFSVIKLSHHLMNAARTGIAFALNFTNVIAKYLSPTDEAKSIKQVEDSLAKTQRQKFF